MKPDWQTVDLEVLRARWASTDFTLVSLRDFARKYVETEKGGDGSSPMDGGSSEQTISPHHGHCAREHSANNQFPAAQMFFNRLSLW